MNLSCTPRECFLFLSTAGTAIVACVGDTQLCWENQGQEQSPPSLYSCFHSKGYCCCWGRAKGAERSPWRPWLLPLLGTREKGIWLLLTIIWTLSLVQVSLSAWLLDSLGEKKKKRQKPLGSQIWLCCIRRGGIRFLIQFWLHRHRKSCAHQEEEKAFSPKRQER